MNQLTKLLYSPNNIAYKTTFNLSRSHSNVVKLLGNKTSISFENVFEIYFDTLLYFNSGFASETRSITDPAGISKEYKSLIQLLFSEEFKIKQALATLSDIDAEESALDFSLFVYYVLLVDFSKIRYAVWDDLLGSQESISSYNKLVYHTCNGVLKTLETPVPILSFEKWKQVASSILLQVRERFREGDNLE